MPALVILASALALVVFFIRAIVIGIGFTYFMISEKLEKRNENRIETARRAERDRIRRERREREAS